MVIEVLSIDFVLYSSVCNLIWASSILHCKGTAEVYMVV